MTSKSFSNAVDVNRQQGGRRNLIINGAMQVAQRGTSFTGLTNGNTQYVLDRFRWRESGTAAQTHTVEQSSDAPDGFGYSLKATLTTGAAVSTSNMYRFDYSIEAQDLQGLAYGTSSAKSTTMSFWVKSNTTGNYAVSIFVEDGSRIIGSTYTINSADTWEYKTITFDGDASGTINNDNGGGFNISFVMSAGSNFTSGDNTSWGAYNANKLAYGQTAVLDTTSDYWQITGVQLEVGTVATPFEHRSYGEELALCQRYYEQLLSSCKTMVFLW